MESRVMPHLIIFGSSNHARVILDAARSNRWEVLGFIDSNRPIGTEVDGLPVLGGDSDLPEILDRYPHARAILGMGENAKRQRVAETIVALAPALIFATLIHPRATIASDVVIQPGCFIAAGATINCGSRIGAHSVINTNASVDHDCILAEYCFVAPNAALAGQVTLERGAFVGIGASVIQLKTISAGALIGAGAAVISDVPPAQIWGGVPAKRIK